MTTQRLVCMYRAATPIYNLSLHDALPILAGHRPAAAPCQHACRGNAKPGPCRGRSFDEHGRGRCAALACGKITRSEEHTSEIQSHSEIVCRLLLEKK